MNVSANYYELADNFQMCFNVGLTRLEPFWVFFVTNFYISQMVWYMRPVESYRYPEELNKDGTVNKRAYAGVYEYTKSRHFTFFQRWIIYLYLKGQSNSN